MLITNATALRKVATATMRVIVKALQQRDLVGLGVDYGARVC